MKHRIIKNIVALIAIASSATAQTLSVASIEAKPGDQTELVVSASGMSSVTALQFNLALPEGVTLAVSGATMGAATEGHTLSVETLGNGDKMFVLYNMNLNTFRDGELLHIPVVIGSGVKTGKGRLYTVRAATTEAVSQTCADVSFMVTVGETVLRGDVNDDGVVNVSDVTATINYILGKNPEKFNFSTADVTGDGSINVSDVTGIINIILGK